MILAALGSLADATASNVALIIVDVQNCFLPNGSLPVHESYQVIPVINNIRRKFGSSIALTVLTQDWHCENHVSFASQHPNKSSYDVITLNYNSSGYLCPTSNVSCVVNYSINQTLWPDHCVKDTDGAKFSDQLVREPTDIVIQKGTDCHVDSYSGFFNNGGFSQTEMERSLRQHNISTVIVTGLAADYCVYYTSKDAKRLGFATYMVFDATKPFAQSTLNASQEDLKNLGVHVIFAHELNRVLAITNRSDFDTPSLSLAVSLVLLLWFGGQ